MSSAIHKRAHRLTRRAKLHLWWEAYAPVMALGVFCVLLFIAGASAGLWQRIGDPWRGISLGIALALMMRSFLRARKLHKPTISQARRRVELDNNLKHRPFDTIHDKSALGASDAPAWQEHLAQAKARVNQAASSRLRPALAPIDPYLLRFLLPCVLLVGAIIGGGDNYERIRASLTPGWISGIASTNAHYEAWIDPPEYTGRPPSYFKKSNTITAPEASEFVARISGVKTAPRLILRENGRTRRITATRLGPESFEARAILSKSATASFRIGSETKTWILNVGEDTPPKIHFDDMPSASKRDKLIFTYTLQDDFGVEGVLLSMRLKNTLTPSETVSVRIPGASVQTTDKEPASLDLTMHKWAGKEVDAYLIATDGKGQSGFSAPETFIVPDKIFVEPLAKAVAEQRLLMLAGTQAYAPLSANKARFADTLENQPLFAVETPERTIERAPEPVQRAALLIEVITDQPAGIYDDPAVYMGLRNIYRRLQGARDQGALAGIPEDLWTIAMRAEFGLLGDALEDMKAAERALNNAMARRAPQREIDTLFARYDAAVERYMEELMLEAAKNAKEQDKNGDGEDQGNGQSINDDMIQQLMDAIAEANRIGDTVAARKALAQLAELLENMKIDLTSGGGGDGVGDDGMSEELKQALEELNDILGEQRKLRDDTQSSGRAESDGTQNSQSGEQKAETPKSGSQLADEQGKLNELLDRLEQGANSGDDPSANENGGNIGEQEGSENGTENGTGDKNGTEQFMTADIEKALDEARRAMGESEDALQNGEFYRAGRAQSNAISALRKAGEALYAEEAERLEKDNEGREGADGDSADADPFGRENDGNGVGDDVDIPEVDDRQRARDLLEELRKRSGEQDRDKTERDYLERLLERF